jgi:hypothetical protein
LVLAVRLLHLVLILFFLLSLLLAGDMEVEILLQMVHLVVLGVVAHTIVVLVVLVHQVKVMLAVMEIIMLVQVLAVAVLVRLVLLYPLLQTQAELLVA